MNIDIQRYIQTMPQYQESLNFLQIILNYQANLVEKIPSKVQIEPAMALKKWQTGQPLFAGESLSIPPPLFREALTDLHLLLPPEESAQVALDRLLDLPLNSETLLDDLLSNGKTYIQQITDAISTDPDTITFLLRTVLSPFIEKQALPYLDLVETVAWRHGICPMCGSEPELTRLAYDNGQRILVCSLCHTEWVFDRLRCPFCQGNSQSPDKLGTQPKLRHFTVGDDEAHRVDCCDRCRRYIKTVDERVSGQPVNLLAEDVITTHLDAVAQEQGYR